MNEKVFYLVIGSFILDKDEEFAKTNFYRKRISVSNQEFEKELLFKSFLRLNISNFIFISAPRVGTYPFYCKKLIVKGFSENDHLKTVKYISPFGVSNFFKKQSIISCIKKVIKTIPNEFVIHVIGAECHGPYLKAIKYLKKHRKCFSTLVVPDLPEHMTKSNNPFYRFFKKIDVKNNYKLMDRYIDSFLCLTKHINQKVNRFNKPYLIREGVLADSFSLDTQRAFSDSNFHCVYIGKTDKINGIDIIVEASKICSNNIVFDVYGCGDMDDILEKARSSSLHFHGFVNPSSVPAIIKSADLVLSPRKPEGEYILYSFPSKIFNYLSHYKKIVTYKLPSYFSDLDKVLYYPDNYSPSALLKTICKIRDEPEDVDKELYNSILVNFRGDEILKSIIRLNTQKNLETKNETY